MGPWTPAGRWSRRGVIGAAVGLGAFAVTSTAAGLSRRLAGLSQARIAALGDRIDGRLIGPRDPAFERARRVGSHNPLTDVDPAAILVCASADDVRRGLDFAQCHDLPLAVRSGGCDVLGQSTCEGGLVLDLSGLSGVVRLGDGQVDIGAGARAGAVNAELGRAGRAIALGCDPGVGIGGLTLGGGFGWLLGLHGASCDSLTEAEVVTPAGQVLLASATQNPDLFWALRGGGGNFGVVTRLRYNSHPVSQVFGGYVVFDIAHAAQVIAAFGDMMRDAPRELTVELAMLATARGPVLVAMVCFAGSARWLDPALAPLRGLAPVLADDVGPRALAEVAVPSPAMLAAFPAPPPEPEPGPGDGADAFNHWRGLSLAAIDDRLAGRIVELARAAPPGWNIGIGHCLRGAVLDAEDTALPRPAGAMSFYLSVSWSRPEDAAARMGWVDAGFAELGRQAAEPTYVNYLSDGRAVAVARAYGDRYARLRALKHRYDPDNVMNRNRNIRPDPGAP
ncbi:FAD-binding oxidoreductase [Maricaulis sp. CAU 1757]